MYTLLKPLQVREELLNRNLRVFTARDFIRVFKTPSRATKYFLETQVQEGFLLRLKRGIYTLKADSPSEEEIANVLYKPSYISFEYALAYYHILPEMPYTITSATTKPTRLFTTSNMAFSYRTIKKEVFTGYVLNKQEHRSFLIAEKEKAIIDYLYFVTLRKSVENERLLRSLKNRSYYKTEGLSQEKIQTYAKLFDNHGLVNLVNDLL